MVFQTQFNSNMVCISRFCLMTCVPWFKSSFRVERVLSVSALIISVRLLSFKSSINMLIKAVPNRCHKNPTSGLTVNGSSVSFGSGSSTPPRLVYYPSSSTHSFYLQEYYEESPKCFAEINRCSDSSVQCAWSDL